MAVKEKTKNKTLKFEDKYLNTLQVLQKDTDRITYNLGQLSIQKERILQTEIQLKEELKAPGLTKDEKIDLREDAKSEIASYKEAANNAILPTITIEEVKL